MKKILAAILALMLSCVFVSCFAEGEALPCVEEYVPVLNAYHTALESGEADAEEIVNPACLYMYNESDVKPLDAVGYCFIDLDGDGSLEMLIGETSGAYLLEKMIYDVYTIVDGKAVLIKRGWERSRLYVCADDWSVVNEWSNSAAVSGNDVYTFENGQLNFVYGVRYNTDEDAENPWSVVNAPDQELPDSKIDEADALTKLNALYGQYADLDMLPLSGYEVIK